MFIREVLRGAFRGSYEDSVGHTLGTLKGQDGAVLVDEETVSSESLLCRALIIASEASRFWVTNGLQERHHLNKLPCGIRGRLLRWHNS